MNGHSCVDIDHYEAVGILKAAGSYITLRVVREIDPDATSSSLPPTLHTQQQVLEQTDQKISLALTKQTFSHRKVFIYHIIT